METKSAVLGAAGMLLAGGLAFGLVATANAQNTPAPAVTSVAPSVTPTPEVTVTTPAPEPVVSTPMVEPVPVAPVAPALPAPVAVEPVPVVEAPAPVGGSTFYNTGIGEVPPAPVPGVGGSAAVPANAAPPAAPPAGPSFNTNPVSP